MIQKLRMISLGTLLSLSVVIMSNTTFAQSTNNSKEQQDIFYSCDIRSFNSSYSHDLDTFIHINKNKTVKEVAPAVTKVWVDRVYIDYKGDTIVITGQYGYGIASAQINNIKCNQFASDPIYLDNNNTVDRWYYYWNCGNIKSGLFEFSVKPYNSNSPYVTFKRFSL